MRERSGFRLFLAGANMERTSTRGVQWTLCSQLDRVKPVRSFKAGSYSPTERPELFVLLFLALVRVRRLTLDVLQELNPVIAFDWF